jgi:hypothetical protein
VTWKALTSMNLKAGTSLSDTLSFKHKATCLTVRVLPVPGTPHTYMQPPVWFFKLVSIKLKMSENCLSRQGKQSGVLATWSLMRARSYMDSELLSILENARFCITGTWVDEEMVFRRTMELFFLENKKKPISNFWVGKKCYKVSNFFSWICLTWCLDWFFSQQRHAFTGCLDKHVRINWNSLNYGLI